MRTSFIRLSTCTCSYINVFCNSESFSCSKELEVLFRISDVRIPNASDTTTRVTTLTCNLTLSFSVSIHTTSESQIQPLSHIISNVYVTIDTVYVRVEKVILSSPQWIVSWSVKDVVSVSRIFKRHVAQWETTREIIKTIKN